MIRNLTEAERRVLNGLGTVFGLFVCLPQTHPDDVEEFRRAIHAAQNILLSRPAYEFENGLVLSKETK